MNYPAPLKPARRIDAGFSTLLLIANAICFFVAYQDQSYRALFIAIIAGPAVNLMFLVGGLFISVLLARKQKRMSQSLIVLAPILAALALSGAILSLDLSGC